MLESRILMPTTRTAAPLTLRALNRATLARQMLLAREKTTPLRVIERLVGMQAQWPRPPFVGIWTRMRDFRREELAKLLRKRKVIRATAFRGTLHMMTAADFLALRAALQPALTHATVAVLRARTKGLDVEKLVAIARPLFSEPHPFEALREVLTKHYPKGDARAIAYMVRTHLPLIQVPTEAPWGFPGTADFMLADSWLGETISEEGSIEPLVLRYLAAFGPASPADMQAWSGLPPALVREAFGALAGKLKALRDDRGRELFDLPRAPRPAEDVVAPARFLPEFDNLLLSHADRTRIVADVHRPLLNTPNLLLPGTFLVDGFVAGTWKAERVKDAATLTVTPFTPLAKDSREALAEEGEALVRFMEDDAKKLEVRFAKGRG